MHTLHTGLPQMFLQAQTCNLSLPWPLTRPLLPFSYDTWIPASEIEAAVEDPPSPEKPRKVFHFLSWFVVACCFSSLVSFCRSFPIFKICVLYSLVIWTNQNHLLKFCLSLITHIPLCWTTLDICAVYSCSSPLFSQNDTCFLWVHDAVLHQMENYRCFYVHDILETFTLARI